MSRWICIDDICIPSDENDWEELVAFADAIAEQEPIDIVRCRECKYWKSTVQMPNGTEVKCLYGRKADDFCSYGEVSEKPTGSENRTTQKGASDDKERNHRIPL